MIARDRAGAAAGPSAPAASTAKALDSRYRMLMKMYPALWRTRNEDAVVGTLLDAAEAESRTRPSRGEIVDLAVHAAAAHVDRVLPAGARDAVASVSLGAGIAYVLVYVFMHTWAPLARHTSDVAAAHPHLLGLNTGAVLLVVWLGLVASTAAGARRTRAVCLVTALVVPSALSLVGMLEPVLRAPSTTHLVLVTLLAVSASLGAPRRRVAVIAACVALAALVFVYSSSGALPGGDDRLLWVRVLAHFPTSAVAVIVCSCVVIVQLVATIASAGRAALVLSLPWVAAWAAAHTEGVAAEVAATSAQLAAAGLVCIALLLAVERSGLAIGLRIRRIRA